MPSSVSTVGEPERNSWNVFVSDEAFMWDVRLPEGLSNEQLLGWQDLILAAGERHQVLRVTAAPTWGYLFERDGPVRAWLSRHGDRIEPIDQCPRGFLLGQLLGFETASRLSYVGPDGIVTGWFSDVMDLAIAGDVPKPKRYDYPPLTVVTAADFDDVLVTGFGLATDIWLSWVRPRAPGQTDLVDNRALAALNAPRLNAFLTEVRDAALSLGGRWTWPESANRRRPHRFDDQGLVVWS